MAPVRAQYGLEFSSPHGIKLWLTPASPVILGTESQLLAGIAI